MKFKMSKNWLLAAVLSVTSLFVSVPKANAQVCDLSLPTTVNYDFIVNNYFPDLALNPAFIAGSASPNVIVTANNTSVTIGYVGKNASWDHRLGYYRYDGSNAIIPGSKTLISFPNNPPQARDLATVGPFNAGDRVGFFVDVYTGGLTEPISHTLYSSINLNSDNITHFAVSDVSVLTGITGLVAVGFEDKLQPANPVLRDIDYNDYIFAYKACGQVDNCSIPNGVCNSTQCTNDPDCECQPGQNEQQACSNTAGVCNSGTQSRTCGQDGRWGSYSACSIQPGTETCNGLDDNCNGIVDDGVPGTGTTCNNGQIGACLQTGVTVCGNGQITCNAQPGTPSIEICDGNDNDCDGEIDEGFVCSGGCDPDLLNQTCSAGQGVCQATGSTVCTSGVVTCNAIAGTAGTEICDGNDNDCDGETDEGFTLGGQCQAGVGACQNTGILACDRSGGVSCDALPGTPNTEICDAIDNDCDGQVDEDFVCSGGCDPLLLNQSCSSGGQGVCNINGSTVCTNAVVTCNATQGSPSAETCDSLDNDCDGQVDEDFVCSGGCDPLTLNQTCVSGTGACQNTGATVCESGSVVCGVSAGAAGVEVCNGIDDDCDGAVDEDSICVVIPVCGNNTIEEGEACDDENTVNGDGCSSTCALENTEPVCGNGLGEPGEACDDGNLVDGDACSSTCSVEQTPAIVSPTSPAPAISSPADQFQGSGEVVSGGCSLNGQSSTQYLGLISMVFSLIILAAMRKKKLS